MSQRSLDAVRGDLLVGNSIPENEWAVLVHEARAGVGSTISRTIQPPSMPAGYSFDFPKLTCFGAIVHADAATKEKHALLIKFAHTDDAERVRLAAEQPKLAEYIRCQDATFEVLCTLLDEDADTQFILEPFPIAGANWPANMRQDLVDALGQDNNRRSRQITLPQAQQILAGQHGAMAFRCMGAAVRFAGYSIQKSQQARILPGRPAGGTVNYPMDVFTNLAARGYATDEEVQAAIDSWLTLRLKDDANRHQFVQQQAAIAATKGKRLVVLYGATHTDKGAGTFHSEPPVDAYLSTSHQVSVLQPYGSDAAPTQGTISLENMTVELLRKAIPGLRRPS